MGPLAPPILYTIVNALARAPRMLRSLSTSLVGEFGPKAMWTKNGRAFGRTCVANGFVVCFQRQTKLFKVNYQPTSWFRNQTKLEAKLVVETVTLVAKLNRKPKLKTEIYTQARGVRGPGNCEKGTGNAGGRRSEIWNRKYP